MEALSSDLLQVAYRAYREVEQEHKAVFSPLLQILEKKKDLEKRRAPLQEKTERGEELTEAEIGQLKEIARQESTLPAPETLKPEIEKRDRIFEVYIRYRDYLSSVFFDSLCFSHDLLYRCEDFSLGKFLGAPNPLVTTTKASKQILFINFLQTFMGHSKWIPSCSVICRHCNVHEHDCIAVNVEPGMCQRLLSARERGITFNLCECVTQDRESHFSQKCLWCISCDCSKRWNFPEAMVDPKFPTLCAVKCRSCGGVYCPFAFNFHPSEPNGTAVPMPLHAPPPQQALRQHSNQLESENELFWKAKSAQQEREILELREKLEQIQDAQTFRLNDEVEESSPEFTIASLRHNYQILDPELPSFMVSNEFSGTENPSDKPEEEEDEEEETHSGTRKGKTRKKYACSACKSNTHTKPRCPYLTSEQVAGKKRKMNESVPDRAFVAT